MTEGRGGVTEGYFFPLLLLRLFNELRAITNSINTRQVVFINPPDAKDQSNPRSGIKTSSGGYYDPWGKEYAIAMDSAYNNQITNPYSDTDQSAGANPLRIGVISWSYGSDGCLGGCNSVGIYKNSDDVISWQ